MLTRFVLTMLTWAALSLCGISSAAEKARDAHQALVAMVHVRSGDTKHAEFGAGIVISQTAERTVLITADHVIHDEKGDIRGEILVEFRNMRGKTFRAYSNPFYADASLDLALLFIDRESTAGTIPMVLTGAQRNALSPTTSAGLRAATVQIVGFMRRQPWAVSNPGNRVQRSDDNALRVSSKELAVGASGGAVFDSFGRLVGMVTHVIPPPEGPAAQALPIRAVLDRLAKWNIDTGLQEAQAPTASLELESQIKDAAVAVQYPPGKMTRGPRFRHTVTLALPPALRELAPTVKIAFPSDSTIQELRLMPPHYTAEINTPPVKLNVELFVEFPDGRELGPVMRTLDFESGPSEEAEKTGKVAQSQVEHAKRTYYHHLDQAKIRQERADKLRSQYSDIRRKNYSSVARNSILRDYPKWHLLCDYRRVSESWDCRQQRAIKMQDEHPEDVIHEIRMGPDPEDLHITVPVNTDTHYRELMKEQAVALLASGAESVYVSLSLRDGADLGVRRLCEVQKVTSRELKFCR